MAESDPHTLLLGQAALDEAARSDTHSETGNGLRRTLLTGIAVVVIGVGATYGGWYALVGRHRVETDNAYVGADTAQVTPLVSGQIIALAKGDTETVKRGEMLVRLDDSDARIALATAEAELAKARRQFGQTSATSSALSAQLRARGADIASTRAQLTAALASYEKAKVDYDRRRKLTPNGAVSGDELTAATNSLASARATVEQARAAVAQATAQASAAQGSLAANDALVSGTTIDTAPDVLAAEARVRQARLDLERTVIRAPVDGVVTGRTVQLGQRVAPGASIMRIVPVAQIYVDANFKEGQLAKVRPGQPVTLSSDLYGSSMEYRGRVVGFSGGTGSAFALIPAQNATGNWIKVVQRLPVRIRLDPKELTAHPLRVGLSMTATIDTSAR